jgi:hypothetical protein
VNIDIQTKRFDCVIFLVGVLLKLDDYGTCRAFLAVY